MLILEILGTIGENAEVKESNGKSYAYFRVAHVEKRKEDGTLQSTWVSVFWRDGYERLLPYLVKGNKVFVRGTLRCNVRDKQDGTPVASISCGAHEVQLCFDSNK